MIRQLKYLGKQVLTRLAPQTTTAIQSARARAHAHGLYREWGIVDLNRKLINQFGPTVQSGPFRGLTLSPMTFQEHLGPYILGTYEAELHSWFEEIAAQRFTQILDVGSKFGYYAVGLSLQMPGVPVTAFDTDWWARAATQEMASANQCPDVTTAGFCSSRWLDRNLQPGSFVLTDCEGYEGKLFARTTTSALDSATLLIEIHDNFVPGVGTAVRERFERTHELAVVESGEPRHLPMELSFLTPSEAATAVQEFRDRQDWLLARPRTC